MRVHNTFIAALGIAVVAAWSLTGCSKGDRTSGPGPLAPQAAAAPQEGELAARRVSVPFDPDHFVSGVDNPYLPFTPGAAYTYVGETAEGTETIVVEVLHQPKTILGVTATVVRDRVYLEGELIEDTFDWYAQDESGNVWYLGEDVKNYEDGALVSTEGSWEAGVDGALAGIAMLADPEKGDSYAQEVAPGVAEDMARVKGWSGPVTVPYATFDEVLEIQEWNPLEPGPRETKYYASGVGLVLETSRQGGGERVELVSVTGL